MPLTTSLRVGSHGASVPLPMAINIMIVVRIRYSPAAISATPASTGSSFSGAASPQPAFVGVRAAISAGIVPAPVTGMAIARACLNIAHPLVVCVFRYLADLIIYRDAAFFSEPYVVVRAFRLPRQPQDRVAALD